MEELDEILFMNEVAKITRKSIPTLEWYRATGRGPKSGKLGRRVIYRRRDVQAWLDEAFAEGTA